MAIQKKIKNIAGGLASLGIGGSAGVYGVTPEEYAQTMGYNAPQYKWLSNLGQVIASGLRAYGRGRYGIDVGESIREEFMRKQALLREQRERERLKTYLGITEDLPLKVLQTGAKAKIEKGEDLKRQQAKKEQLAKFLGTTEDLPVEALEKGAEAKLKKEYGYHPPVRPVTPAAPKLPKPPRQLTENEVNRIMNNTDKKIQENTITATDTLKLQADMQTAPEQYKKPLRKKYQQAVISLLDKRTEEILREGKWWGGKKYTKEEAYAMAKEQVYKELGIKAKTPKKLTGKERAQQLIQPKEQR